MTDEDIDIFDREAVFIERHLGHIAERFPNLKIVFEHITTEQGVNFVRDSSENVAATITPQHLLYNRNDMLVGGIRPHLFCLPILKRNPHQQALIDAAVSGDQKFFLGTDSHPTPETPRKPPVAVLGVTATMQRLSCTPRCLIRRERWIDLKRLPVKRCRFLWR